MLCQYNMQQQYSNYESCFSYMREYKTWCIGPGWLGMCIDFLNRYMFRFSPELNILLLLYGYIDWLLLSPPTPYPIHVTDRFDLVFFFFVYIHSSPLHYLVSHIVYVSLFFDFRHIVGKFIGFFFISGHTKFRCRLSIQLFVGYREKVCLGLNKYMGKLSGCVRVWHFPRIEIKKRNKGRPWKYREMLGVTNCGF